MNVLLLFVDNLNTIIVMSFCEYHTANFFSKDMECFYGMTVCTNHYDQIKTPVFGDFFSYDIKPTIEQL